MTRAFRGDHAHVDVRRWLDESETDVEAVREEERVAVIQVGFDGLRVQLLLCRVGHQNHDDVRLRGSGSWIDDAQPVFLRLRSGLGPLLEADANINTGIPQGQRVGMALAAEPHNRDLPALNDGKVGVVVVIHLGHGGCLLGRWGG